MLRQNQLDVPLGSPAKTPVSSMWKRYMWSCTTRCGKLQAKQDWISITIYLCRLLIYIYILDIYIYIYCIYIYNIYTCDTCDKLSWFNLWETLQQSSTALGPFWPLSSALVIAFTLPSWHGDLGQADKIPCASLRYWVVGFISMLYYIIMKIEMEHIILNKWDRKMRYCCYIKPTNQLRTISSGSLEIAPARSLQLTHGPECPNNPPDHEKEPAKSMYTQETIK